MNALWWLWFVYCLAFLADFLYVQPYRQRRAAERGKDYAAGSISFGLAVSLPIFGAILLARTFVVDIYHVPSASMEPTLNEGSRILVNRLAYGIRSPLNGRPVFGYSEGPAAGEIVVFRYPREPRTAYVKRILAVPGDHVRVAGDLIEVNGDSLFRYPNEPTTSPRSASLGSVTYQVLDDPLIESSFDIDVIVPDGHYFAVGDNLNHSEDSRQWGFVGYYHLIGRVFL